jgi:hypothetical protein
VRVRTSGFSKVIRRKGMTRLIVDTTPTREIDSQRRLSRGKCNYADDYAPRTVTMRVFPFACLANPHILPSGFYCHFQLLLQRVCVID